MGRSPTLKCKKNFDIGLFLSSRWEKWAVNHPDRPIETLRRPFWNFGQKFTFSAIFFNYWLLDEVAQLLIVINNECLVIFFLICAMYYWIDNKLISNWNWNLLGRQSTVGQVLKRCAMNILRGLQIKFLKLHKNIRSSPLCNPCLNFLLSLKDVNLPFSLLK